MTPLVWASLASVGSRSKTVEIDRARARARAQESERRFFLGQVRSDL